MAEYKTTTMNCKTIGVHRKVWIEHNGSIPKGYIVHHIHGDKHDNRIENLIMLSKKQHGMIHSKKEINRKVVSI